MLIKYIKNVGFRPQVKWLDPVSRPSNRLRELLKAAQSKRGVVHILTLKLDTPWLDSAAISALWEVGFKDYLVRTNTGRLKFVNSVSVRRAML